MTELISMNTIIPLTSFQIFSDMKLNRIFVFALAASAGAAFAKVDLDALPTKTLHLKSL